MSGSLILLLFIILILAWIGYNFLHNLSNNTDPDSVQSDSLRIKDSLQKLSQDYLRSVTSDDSANIKIIRVSDPSGMNIPFSLDNNAGKQIKRIFTGRRINIAVIGVDSRVGTSTKHADANHVISILIDSGTIEITSIPRDTPADAGMPDTSGQNKLTIVRSARGRDAYLEEVADIAGLDKIQYYCEVSFSQVMGIIEFLGFKDSKSYLQVLRSRTGLGGDDFQRCYNQGQFIRQNILKNFRRLDGMIGEVLIRGGIAMVETNLSTSNVKDIIAKLKGKGFPRSEADISIRVRPPMPSNFKVYDFSDEKVVNQLKQKIEFFNQSQYDIDSSKKPQDSVSVERILKNAIARAALDTAKKPQNSINTLKVFYEQHAWLQVPDLGKRQALRSNISNILINSYIKKKQPDMARKVKESIDAEIEFFKNKF